MDAGLSRRLRGLLLTREPTGGLKEWTAAGNGPARRMLSITLGAGGANLAILNLERDRTAWERRLKVNDLQNEILDYLKQHHTVIWTDLLTQPFSGRSEFKQVLNDLEAMGTIRLIRSTRTAAREILIVDLIAK